MPSLVAEIGDAIEAHMKSIGLIEDESLSEAQREVLEQKRQEYDAKNQLQGDTGEFPATAELCLKCHTKAVIMMDGCRTCLNCGASKCG